MKIRILNLVIVLLLSNIICGFAQNVANSDNAVLVQYSSDSSCVTLIQNYNLKQLEKEDELNERIGAPVRTAMLLSLEVNILNLAKQSIIDSYEVFTFTVKSPNANGLFLRFTDFYIPEDGRLYVYNDKENTDTRFYEHQNNPKGGAYAVNVYSSDVLIFEYVRPVGSSAIPRFKMDAVGHRYRRDNATANSVNCSPDINCVEGKSWQKEKRGIVRFEIDYGMETHMCTGSLVNNTAEDRTAYVLTAAHCFPGKKNTDITHMRFYFNDELLTCEGASPESEELLLGADMMAYSPLAGGSDMALIKIKKEVPATFKPYYNGWNRTSEVSTIKSGAVIHHPQGVEKKITLYSRVPSISTWQGLDPDKVYVVGMPQAHLNISYSLGATSGGSSGSPMFDQNHLIIGTLSGGTSSCSTTNNADTYGRFHYHWDKTNGLDAQLKGYLDPLHTDAMTLQGLGNPDDEAELPEISAKAPQVYAYWDDNNIRENLTVQLKDLEDEVKSVKVYNKYGFAVYTVDSINYPSYSYTISDISWNRGLYFLSIQTKKGTKDFLKIIR